MAQTNCELIWIKQLLGKHSNSARFEYLVSVVSQLL